MPVQDAFGRLACDIVEPFPPSALRPVVVLQFLPDFDRKSKKSKVKNDLVKRKHLEGTYLAYWNCFS